jgi:hypothetical protein
LDTGGWAVRGFQQQFEFHDNIVRGGVGFKGSGEIFDNYVRGGFSISADSAEIYNNHFEFSGSPIYSGGSRFLFIHHNTINNTIGNINDGYGDALDIRNCENLESSYNIIRWNIMRNVIAGPNIGGPNLKVEITNNIIDEVENWGFYAYDRDDNELIFANNIISRAKIGFLVQRLFDFQRP